MIDSEGNFVGQVCHIEAAMPGGERFNLSMTNEERRQFSNLMLMCYRHHIVTNNVEEYAVERLQAIKEAHEDKFSHIIAKLEQSIEDLTSLQVSHYPSKLLKLNEVLGWGNTEEELRENIVELNKWVDRLKKLTPDTRKIFVIMLDRSIQEKNWTLIPIDEVHSVIKLESSDLKKQLNFVERYGFICSHFKKEGENMCELNQFESGWPFWDDLIEFTKKTSYSLDEIIVNLNFSVLD
ncbi:hypothetical protein P4K67_22070 [Bacillus cereus]|nr:hypothetical protein [Bacillus cereus]